MIEMTCFFIFRQRDTFEGQRLGKRAIARKYGIPETTFIDQTNKKREADGYPRFGRSNEHAKLLTAAEEQVSFLYFFIKFQVSS